MPNRFTRRDCLAAFASSALLARTAAAAPKTSSGKPMEGAFIIMATPYTESKAVDYEDLAGEVDYLDRAGVQGMVWPQMASEYDKLTEDERMRGMEALAKAAKGKSPALVLGLQAEDEAGMLRYARHAEKLAPDAVIAMPPKKAKSLDDYRSYYSALCETAHRPVFIQTTGGAKDVEPTVEFIVEMARKYPNFGYVKEELKPLAERVKQLAEYKPDPIKAVFSGSAGRGWTYEMRLGVDGTMPGAMYAEIYPLLWELERKGDMDKLREVFSKLMVMINLDQQIPGTRSYMFHKRGIFKTTVSRKGEYSWTPEQVAEMDWALEGIKPYLKS